MGGGLLDYNDIPSPIPTLDLNFLDLGLSIYNVQIKLMFLPYKYNNPENCIFYGSAFRYSMSNCVFESAFEATLTKCGCYPLFHQELYAGEYSKKGSLSSKDQRVKALLLPCSHFSKQHDKIVDNALYAGHDSRGKVLESKPSQERAAAASLLPLQNLQRREAALRK